MKVFDPLDIIDCGFANVAPKVPKVWLDVLTDVRIDLSWAGAGDENIWSILWKDEGLNPAWKDRALLKIKTDLTFV